MPGPVPPSSSRGVDCVHFFQQKSTLLAVRLPAERRNIGWAYWDDGGSFKLMNVSNGTWNESLRKALLEK